MPKSKEKMKPGVRHESVPQDTGSDPIHDTVTPCAFCGTSGLPLKLMEVRQTSVHPLCEYCQCIPLPANLLAINMGGIISHMDMLRMNIRLMQTMEQRIIEALT